MWTLIFLFLFIVSTGVAITFLVLLLETKGIGRAKIRKWRVAISGRLELMKTRKALEAADQQARRRSDDADALAHRLIADDHAAFIETVSSKNYHRKKAKFKEMLAFAAKHGTAVPPEERRMLWGEIEEQYAKVKKIEEEKAKQAEIRAQAREEEKERRERERAVKEAERLEEIKRRALEEAIRLMGDETNEKIEQLKAELAEAQAATERTKSQAQLTKEGHVYVISNVGSFGKDVYKVGLTRRLEPEHRVNELGDASVPFPFDIHAMIFAQDSPALEAALHRELADHRLNRVNLRKEFFKIKLDRIIEAARKHHDAEVEYVMDPEAAEYFESLEIERAAMDGEPDEDEVKIDAKSHPDAPSVEEAGGAQSV